MLPLLPRCRHPLRHGTLGQQHLLGALANKSTTVHPASVSSKAPRPAASCSVASCSVASCSVASSSQQQLSHHGAPASNKPHPAEKSTPAWLAIWCTWAGFANSQLLPDAAALSSIHGLPRSGNSSAQTSASLHPPAALRLRVLPFTRGMVAHGLCGSLPDSAVNLSPWIASAQTDANLSAHLLRLPTPPPYLRRMRLSHGQDAGVWYWIWLIPGLVHRSSKSPSTRIAVLEATRAHWRARWPQFVLTKHGSKS